MRVEIRIELVGIVDEQVRQRGHRCQRDAERDALLHPEPARLREHDDAGQLGDESRDDQHDREQPADRDVAPRERREREHEQDHRQQPAGRAEMLGPQLRTRFEVLHDDAREQQREQRRQLQRLRDRDREHHEAEQRDERMLVAHRRGHVAEQVIACARNQIRDDERTGDQVDGLQDRRENVPVRFLVQPARHELGQHDRVDAVQRGQRDEALRYLPFRAQFGLQLDHHRRRRRDRDRRQHERDHARHAEREHHEQHKHERQCRLREARCDEPRIAADPFQIETAAELEQQQPERDVDQQPRGFVGARVDHAESERSGNETDHRITGDARQPPCAIAQLAAQAGRKQR